LRPYATGEIRDPFLNLGGGALRKKLVGAFVVGIASLAFAQLAFGAVTVAFNASVKPNKAGKPTALNTHIAASDPAAEQPPIMNRIVIKLNAGGTFNGGKFPRCKLSALQSKGPSGCPSKSKIGTGNGVGYARPVVTDPVSAKLTIFNGEKKGGSDQIFVFVLPDLGPTFVTVGKVIHKKDGPFDYTLDFAIPAIKTLPSAPDASVGTVDTKTPIKKIKKGKRTFYLIVAPKKCKGSWKAEGDFYFATGAVVKVPVSQKCKK
jgi:hypothetical protein